MPYEGPFSNRLADNLVRITAMGTSYVIPDKGEPVKETTQGEEGTSPSMEASQTESAPIPIILDATEEYGKNLSAQITNHPVGNKTDRADHYYVNPLTIDISGVISNDKLNSVYNWIKDRGKTTLQQMVETLEKLVTEKQLVRIEIPDTPVVDNCLITSLSITRDSRMSNGFRVELSAQQIEVIKSDIIKEPVADKRDSTSETTKTGNRTTSSVAEAAEAGSEGSLKLNQKITKVIYPMMGVSADGKSNFAGWFKDNVMGS